MGNLYQRTRLSNLFIYVPTGEYFYRHKANGKSLRDCLNTTVFTVARIRLAEKLRQQRALRRADGDPTVGDLAAIFRSRIQSDAKLKPRSKAYWLERAKALMDHWPELGALSPSNIEDAQVRKWAADYRAKYHATNYNNTMSVLKKLFALAIESGLMIHNPAAVLKRAPVPRRVPDLPTPEMFRKLIETMRAAGGRFSMACADLVELLAYTGLRCQSEAAHLKWCDVDFARNQINVRGDPTTGTKGVGGARCVPLLPEAFSFLKARTECNQARSRILPVASCDSALKRACSLLGIPKLRHHDLRHYFATRCIESGVDIPTVADWLGHKDGGSLLLKTYRHLRQEHSQAMAAKVRIG